MSISTPVVVVGAGPTGCAVAIELGLRGVECLVLDRWEGVYPQPRAVHLDDEVFRVLARLGVASAFTSISRPGRGLRLLDRRLRVLGEFVREGVSAANGFPRANMFDQPELEAVLRARLHELPTVTLRGGVEVTDVAQRAPGHVTVRLRDTATGAQETVDAEVLLGCDGANSLVRSAIGAAMEDLGFEQRWLVLDVATSADLDQWEGVHQVCDTARAATYMRIGDTRYRWEFQLLDGEIAADFGTLEAVEPLIRPWLGDVPRGDLELLRAAEYTFRAAVADRWRDGRIFLLGDAAHLTPPFIGQGMGAGIRDAANLGWKVAGFLRGELAAEVLDTYEPERRAHARSMVQLARRLGVVMTRGGRGGDLVRRAVAPLVAHTPVIGAPVTDSTTPPLGPTRRSPRRRGDRLAGRLAPNPLVGECRLDDIVGPGWSLVTAAAPSPTDGAALRSLGCTVVDAGRIAALDDWLREGRAVAALVRPDRTVLASGADVPGLCATLQSLVAPSPQEVPA